MDLKTNTVRVKMQTHTRSIISVRVTERGGGPGCVATCRVTVRAVSLAGTCFSDTVSVRTQCIVAQSYNNSPFERAFAKQAAAMKCLYTTRLRFAKRCARNAAAPVIIRPRLGGRARTDRTAVTQTRKCDLPSTSNVIKVLHLLHFACSPSRAPPSFLSVLANICHNLSAHTHSH